MTNWMTFCLPQTMNILKIWLSARPQNKSDKEVTHVEFCCQQEITHPGSYHTFPPQMLLYLVFQYRRGSCKSGLGDGTWQTDCSSQTDRISPRSVTQADKDITYRGRHAGGQGCTVKYIAHLFWQNDGVHDPQGEAKIYSTRHRSDRAKMSTSCYAWDRKDKRTVKLRIRGKKIENILQRNKRHTFLCTWFLGGFSGIYTWYTVKKDLVCLLT